MIGLFMDFFLGTPEVTRDRLGTLDGNPRMTPPHPPAAPGQVVQGVMVTKDNWHTWEQQKDGNWEGDK